MPAKIKDDEGKQLYSRSFPEVFPDDSELSVYSSQDNSRVLIKHKSGSHIEFKNDGSVFIKANKDLLVHCGIESETMGEGDGNPSISAIHCDSDLLLNVAGQLKVDCKRFDLYAKEAGYVNTSGDFNVNANNNILRAKEQVSLEPTKSLYVSTGELRENITTRTTEAGSKPSGKNKAIGGQNVTRVSGHHVIENTDPKGGITIKSAGYLNIVTAAERIDITGDPSAVKAGYDPTPFGKATYTHIIKPYAGPTPKGVPGSSYFQCGPGGLTEMITGPVKRTNIGSTEHTFTGPFEEQYDVDKVKNVMGPEEATITGKYVVKAQLIFLN
jgi:hypothetical protein